MSIHVEVVYATPEQQTLMACELPLGSCVADAITASGVLARYPNLAMENLAVGIFAKRCALDTVVSSGDRIEIYRPLSCDPKARRKKKARSA